MKLVRLPPLQKFALPALFVFAFGAFLILTFPFDTVARRLEAEARRSGSELSIGSLGAAGVFGLRARDVKLRVGPDASGPEYVLTRVDLSPDLFSLLLRRVGFGFVVQAYGGSARGHAKLSNDPQQPGLAALELEAKDVDVHALPLPLPEVEVAGKLTLKLDLPVLQPYEAATGQANLTLKSAGLVHGVARMEGGMSMALPQVSLGEVDAAFTVDKGLARIDKLSAKGGDLEADVDGTVRLRPALMLSQADVHARVRPADKWLDQNPMIRGAMSFLGPRAPDGTYTVSATGPLMRLQPRPGR